MRGDPPPENHSTSTRPIPLSEETKYIPRLSFAPSPVFSLSTTFPAALYTVMGDRARISRPTRVKPLPDVGCLSATDTEGKITFE